MGLSRLDNFLKSARGTILYVNPNDLDATDSIENQGNSLTRPFKTIQRALIEAARFSYQRGLNNDRFGKTTILLYPGDHIVDNRPGWIPDGVNNYRLRNGTTSNNLPPFDLNSNFDLTNPNNELYKLNSIHGGVILPRGTSIVGLDLRKTKIIPKYVPNPSNDDIERSTIFRLTGSCYLWQFSIFDADPNGVCYKDYTGNTFVPNFSHHKLSCFEYADGVNGVDINDIFQTYSTSRTDLDMYYEKVGLVYGQSSGRPIEPDYPSSSLDIQAKIDEYRIVGSTGASVGISSIKSGDGVTPTTSITVTTVSPVPGLDVDTPFRITGVTALGYNGQFVVAEKLNDTEIVYKVQNAPTTPLPSSTGATLFLQSDTVTSASPYVFNVSLRSVYGMCGLLADGAKATGFKSMVVAQFTGIGLQKDDDAFVKYNTSTGLYDDSTALSTALSTDSLAVFKPSYKNFHIKSTNNSFIQCVSVFAIGYAEHFVAENGGDMSITNSNSNFGAKALVASGFRNDAFPQDDLGYITHVIPPKEITLVESSIEFNAIDVLKTLPAPVGVGTSTHLYLYGETNQDVPPENVLEGYRIGAKENDQLYVLVSSGGVVTEYTSRIVMDNSDVSSEKSFNVNRSVTGINSIGTYSIGGVSNTFTLTEPHTFSTGETIRIISENGSLPDGLIQNTVYYAITGLSTNVNIQVAKTLNDALNGNALPVNEKGGTLKVVSRVSDKNSGDIGHPIQYDISNSQWYINVSSASTENQIYSTIVGLGSTGLGNATSRTFIRRRQDNRNSVDTLYRMRYVIPKDSGNIVARPPSDGFILQESNTSIGSTNSEIQNYFGSGSIVNQNQLRNFRFIANAEWDGSNAKITTELPHNLSVGSEVELVNVTSTLNSGGERNSGFNRNFVVTGISSAKNFTVGLATDPGSFTNDTSSRTVDLPYFKRKRYNDTYYIYRNQEVQRYVPGEQDGIYYLTFVNASNRPSVVPFSEEKYSQPVKELYPQINRDNPNSDPEETKSFASSSLIGEVVVNDVRNSITKETLNKMVRDSDVGVGITNIVSSSGIAHTIFTSIDHGLNKVTKLTIVDAGSGYGFGSAGDFYNARLVSIGASASGSNATAKITVDGSGSITSIKIMDGGSAYGIGNTLTITGTATTTGFSQAVVRVDAIYNNINDVIRVTGVSSEAYSDYNTLYRIVGVTTGKDREVIVESSINVGSISSTGVGADLTSDSHCYVTGGAIRLSSLLYDSSSGIATAISFNSHGLSVDTKVRIVGANETEFNGDFVVAENLSLSSFSINIGTGKTITSASGTLYAYREGFASNEGVVSIDNENISGRMVPVYAGITTTLSADIINETADEVYLSNVANLDVNIGDYLLIDSEIVRVKTTVSNPPTNPIRVFRGVLGSKPTTHTINTIARRISVNPVEFRRHSINRASSHTFEYVGFGPGNYSTSLPDKQNRSISPQEELLAQSTRREAGINFYTGMNDKGISYSGNKKLSTVTGQEEIFDTPILTVTGEDIGNIQGINVINPIEGLFTRSIRVEGGTDGKATSEFNGPVVFSGKVTSTSSKGFESNSLFLQGDATVSRKYTVGVSAPSLSGNPGDIVYYANPSKGGYSGWIYTLDNEWFRFGNVSISKDYNIAIFDKVGIAITDPGDCTLKVGAGSSLFCVDGDGVGIGTTANTFKLHVNGDTNIIGTCYASSFSGDGSGLTSLNAAALGWTQISGGIYNTSLNNVGIGTSVPRFNLELGSVGSASTSIYVNGIANFVGILTANDIFVSGIITATSYDLQNSSTGRITAGIITSTNLVVGTSGTTLITSSANVGVGTTVPRAKFDVEGLTRLKTYSESVSNVASSGGVVTVDLAQSQNFNLTLTENITHIIASNIPSDVSSFTIKITQDASSAYTVDLDDLRNSGGSVLPVYWAGGGIIPIMTPTVSRTDIYTYKTFDGGSNWYGIVIGQNFTN